VTKPEGKNLIQACLNAPDSNETVSQRNDDDDVDDLTFFASASSVAQTKSK
jgi:hypothetical protein